MQTAPVIRESSQSPELISPISLERAIRIPGMYLQTTGKAQISLRIIRDWLMPAQEPERKALPVMQAQAVQPEMQMRQSSRRQILTSADSRRTRPHKGSLEWIPPGMLPTAAVREQAAPVQEMPERQEQRLRASRLPRGLLTRRCREYWGGTTKEIIIQAAVRADVGRLVHWTRKFRSSLMMLLRKAPETVSSLRIRTARRTLRGPTVSLML